MMYYRRNFLTLDRTFELLLGCPSLTISRSGTEATKDPLNLRNGLDIYFVTSAVAHRSRVREQRKVPMDPSNELDLQIQDMRKIQLCLSVLLDSGCD